MESQTQNKNLENQLNLNTQQIVENFNDSQINQNNNQEENINLKNYNKKIFENIKNFLLVKFAPEMKNHDEMSKLLKKLENAKKEYDKAPLKFEILKQENNLLKNLNNLLTNFFSNLTISKNAKPNEEITIKNIKNLIKFYEENKLYNIISNSTKEKKTALMLTFSTYSKELKKLNYEIFIETEKMERYLDHIYKKTHSLIFNVEDNKNTSTCLLRIITQIMATINTIKIRRNENRFFEKLILKKNEEVLKLLQEKFKTNSLKFEFNKIKDIIEKIKEKKEYLNKLKNFNKILISPKKGKEGKEYEKYLNLPNVEENLNEDFAHSSSLEEYVKKDNFNPEIYEYFNFLNFKEAKNYLDENFKNENNSNNYLKIFKFQVEFLNKILLMLGDIKEINNQYRDIFFEIKNKEFKKILESCWLWYTRIMDFLTKNSQEKIDFLNSKNN